ncbi:MAG: ferrous iron transporter B [Candidatus Diapherotrites archaeon]|nr:ferrous iron transporter B [Candidatus Diapherotrites archaeon]
MKDCCKTGIKLKGADIALLGNPNVGKSALINQLTGIGATVSNYPGTTVEILEGECNSGKEGIVRIADLPGIYSIHGSSEDELVAWNYIKSSEPKAIINVVDATKLERNLFLTLQLIALKRPMVIALNFNEEAEEKGMKVNAERLSEILGVPVVKINAVRGLQVNKLVEEAVKQSKSKKLKKRIISREQGNKKNHSLASSIAEKSVSKTRGKKTSNIKDYLDSLTTDQFSGTIILVIIMALLFAALFIIGSGLSGIIGNAFQSFAAPFLNSLINLVPNKVLQETLKYMFVDGINAGLQIAIPFVLVFYAIIAVLEDCGYLPRMAFLMDKTMHKLGLHGKAVIPMMLGFGCSVPAIISTRVLPNPRERLLTAILIVLIPCSARTAVILGAVGLFVGWQYALLIYAFLLLLIFASGFILGKALPGEQLGIIMEMPPYRLPRAKNVLMKTWIRVKDFIISAFPLIFLGSGVLGGLKALGLLESILAPAQPLISGWLLLPSVAGITLVFGVLRKELALEMLVVLGGSASLLAFMSRLQIFVFALVVAIYIPCIATVGVLNREFGWKKAAIISASTISLAILIGGIAARILPAFGLLS